MSNFIQPGTPTTSGVTGTAAGNPTVNGNVGNYPVGANVLGVSWPRAAYVQPTDQVKVGTVNGVRGVPIPQGVIPGQYGAGAGQGT